MPKFEIRPGNFDGENSGDHYLEIVEGKFKGVCFNFGMIQFVDEDKEGNGRVSFNYKVLQHTEETLLMEGGENKELEEAVSDVLRVILENISTKDIDSNEDGNTDPEQPVT
jgi:hypothetical protein